MHEFKVKLAIFKATTGYTNRELAEDMGVIPHTVTNWSKTGKISYNNAKKLTELFPKFFTMKLCGH